MKITAVVPRLALPGGLVQVEMEGCTDPLQVQVEVGGVAAEIPGASSRSLTIMVPDQGKDGLLVRSLKEEACSKLRVGRLLASELHTVANPVVDSMGNIYVTYSGARGEKVSSSVFVVYTDGSKHPFLADITNPTGLAIGPDDCLYISSRHTGAIYRSSFDKQVEQYIDGLGQATGLVFDSKGNLLVGDRSGIIYKVTPESEVSVLCELEPSVSAYHFAIDEEDILYATGPTLATQDCIHRISPDGSLQILFKGFGRPQGLAFDPEGHLQVVASYRGRKGLYTLREGSPKLTVSGPMLVGIAYSRDKSKLYLVDNQRMYELPMDTRC